MSREKPQIANDDLLDVMEMTQKLEESISLHLDDMNADLAISSLISATINCICAQCNKVDEVIFFRNIFLQVFDGHIRAIKIKPDQQPGSWTCNP